MNETKKGFIQLHLSVLLAGFTGLFGRLITLNEVDIVWYRMLFTSCILLVFTGLPRVGWRKFLQLCGCGALLGLHWILFYGSIMRVQTCGICSVMRYSVPLACIYYRFRP